MKVNPKHTSLPLSKQSFQYKYQEKSADFSDLVSVRILISTYLSYFILTILAHIDDLIEKVINPAAFVHLKTNNGYAPLMNDFESLYIRRIYYRIRDCWNRPTTGVPGSTINVLIRTTADHNATFQPCINLASYNYLGFSQPQGPCQSAALDVIKHSGVSMGAPSIEIGLSPLLSCLESQVAKFLGVEAALVCAMGFATNSTSIPAFGGRGTLLLSDELNHSSLIFGARLSGSIIRVFRHNDMLDLERLLREVIVEGQPRTHRPWSKIIVIVEGLYSMEGHFAPIPHLLQLKKKYKFYLFVDEAHSIGAVGPRGRGVCDHFGVDPRSVDIIMGTFTKSFGGAGGYIAGSRQMVNHIRAMGHNFTYCEPLSPPVCQQIITALKLIDDPKEGKERIHSLHQNSSYFRKSLINAGLVVGGAEGSPVIPMLIFQPSKMAYLSRRLLELDVASVVVGYPATPINQCRARFCMTSGHSKEELDRALKAILAVAEEIQIPQVCLE